MKEYKSPELEIVRILDVIRTSDIIEEEPFEEGDNIVDGGTLFP